MPFIDLIMTDFDASPAIILIILVAVASSLLRRFTYKMRQRVEAVERRNAPPMNIETSDEEQSAENAPTMYTEYFNNDYVNTRDMHDDVRDGSIKMDVGYPDKDFGGSNRFGRVKTTAASAQHTVNPIEYSYSDISDGEDAIAGKPVFTPEQMREGIIMKEILTRRIWTPERGHK